ncbi:hypothetical protein FQA39_LY13524 [Lamprigera yunnana]|nr:hypothetical protein FQA39_LY13524 [Lamprigera yunnana]
MEWFGITAFGHPDYIKSMMREDYKEPEKLPSMLETIEKGTKQPIAELMRELDVYIGQYDGFQYKSAERMKKQQKKGAVKPIAPNMMYRYPMTDAQNFGFWMNDSALTCEDWYKSTVYKPKSFTEIGRLEFNKIQP